MNLIPINQVTLLPPGSPSTPGRTTEHSAPGNIQQSNHNENYSRDIAPWKEQHTETASTRGAPVINDITPGRTTETSEQRKPDSSSSAPQTSNSTSARNETDSTGLTPEEKKEVQELKEQDTKVRRHEQAHVMAGGRYIRSRAQFQYVTGPDGKQYAVSGEVQIDTSEVPDDPEATIQKAQVVRRAALAPADPSPQDRRVAAEANRMEFEARMEIAQQRAEKLSPTDESEESEQASLSPSESNLLDLFV